MSDPVGGIASDALPDYLGDGTRDPSESQIVASDTRDPRATQVDALGTSVEEVAVGNVAATRSGPSPGPLVTSATGQLEPSVDKAEYKPIVARMRDA
jgi:hypothetical protein